MDFGYEKGKPILQDISIDALPGQKIALVGATGAGKTTITNLLTRFYDIASGSITYDGIPLEQIRKGLSAGPWAWCSRIRCCLPPRCWKTSGMDAGRHR